MNRILFVDDEVAVLDSIRRLLRPQRFLWQMEFANDAASALELIAAEPFEVVVTDFRMPGMDGDQLLAIVRERSPATARLILSGYSGKDASMAAGGLVHQYLNKPCSRDDLVLAIERAISHSYPRR